MKPHQLFLLVVLAAIWGSSFIFMRATAEIFGPVFLITIRVGVAALCLLGFLLVKHRQTSFLENWKILLVVGLFNSAVPFILFTYASLSLNAGFVSIMNAMTPIFTAWIAHIWLRDYMSKAQMLGLFISILGLVVLVWDKLTLEIGSWQAMLAVVAATLSYGVAANSTKKYLANVTAMTATAGSLLFGALFVGVAGLFFLPDFSKISPLDWSYALTLAVVCTAIAYVIFFKLIQEIGPARAVSVTFLVPIFAFIWAYLLLGEVLTLRMIVATVIILSGMSLVTKMVKFGSATD